MKSKVNISVDGESKPIIRFDVTLSEDVRDLLAKQFTEKLGGDSSWCTIKCIGTSHTGENTWYIAPMTPEEMEAQALIMLEQVRLRKEFDEQWKASQLKGDEYPPMERRYSDEDVAKMMGIRDPSKKVLIESKN